MKKEIIFVILGIVFFIISFILFFTLTETIENPNCVPHCDYLKYVDAFTPTFKCSLLCSLNEEGKDYVIHNPIYVLSVWLGIISFIIALILFLAKVRKNEKNKR